MSLYRRFRHNRSEWITKRTAELELRIKQIEHLRSHLLGVEVGLEEEWTHRRDVIISFCEEREIQEKKLARERNFTYRSVEETLKHPNEFGTYENLLEELFTKPEYIRIQSRIKGYQTLQNENREKVKETVLWDYKMKNEIIKHQKDIDEVNKVSSWLIYCLRTK